VSPEPDEALPAVSIHGIPKVFVFAREAVSRDNGVMYGVSNVGEFRDR